MVNYNHPSRTKKPGTLARHNPYRSRTEYHHGVSGFDAAHFGRLISGGHHIGQQYRIIMIHIIRYDHRPYIGIRNPDIFRLASIVAPSRMGVSIKTADRGRMGIGFIAGAREHLLGKTTFTTGNVKWHDDVVAHFYTHNGRAQRLCYSYKFVAAGRAHPGLWYQSMVKV